MAFLITKPLAEQKVEYIEQVNQLAMDKIVITYPFYLQHNIARDALSAEAISMFAWIDSARAFADIAKAEIAAATDMVEIRASMASFIASLSLIV